ncbi:MAG: hypothetical protein P1U89_20980 [Verrucomicrobiales bacterium]|nr:hypothetical protein [Verrucomicrobiales bacterium]
MKKNPLKLILTLSILVPCFGAGNDQLKNRSEEPRPVSTAKAPPFKNHWDSGSWEKRSAQNFWREAPTATQSQIQSTTPAAPRLKPVKKIIVK